MEYKMREDGTAGVPSSLAFPPLPPVFSVIYQQSGKLPRKSAAANFVCIFPKPAPARGGVLPVPLHLGVLPASLFKESSDFTEN